MSCRTGLIGLSTATVLSLMLVGCSNDDDAAADPAPSETSASESASTASTDAYVPASAEGPAQNVPKPTKPALADEESVEGAQAFLDYLSDARSYAMQTGDTSFARDVTTDACEPCIDDFDSIDAHYEAGGWGSSGREEFDVESDELAIDSKYNVYVVQAELKFEGLTFWDDKGAPTMEKDPEEHSHDRVSVYLAYQDESWIFITTGPGL